MEIELELPNELWMVEEKGILLDKWRVKWSVGKKVQETGICWELWMVGEMGLVLD